MKILYHHRIRSKDGQYVHVEELVHALRAAGHEVVVVGPAAIEQEAFGADAGFVGWLKRRLPRALYEMLEMAYAFVDYARLVRAVRRHRPDGLYERYNLFLPSGTWVKRRFKLPMLLEVNAPLYHERKNTHGIALDRLAAWSERRTWRGADFVLPVTAVLAGYVRARGVPDARIVVVPNGIDTARFGNVPAAAAAKRRLGLEGRFVLGFVGFMRAWHGLERVVELLALAAHQNRHLLLVGDGPARTELEQTARRLGVAGRVTITGVVARAALADYIAAFDVALQPDVVPYASPLKLFEYLGYGRVIVAPAAPNIKEVLVDGENAILFEPGSAASLAAAVERACTDAALRARVAAGARATIIRGGFTWEHNAQVVTRLFHQLLERGGAARA